MLGMSRANLDLYAQGLAKEVSPDLSDTANAAKIVEVVRMYPVSHEEKMYMIARLPAHGVSQDITNAATLMLGPEKKEEGWPLWAQIVVWGVGLVVVEEVVRYVFFRRKD